MLVRFTPLALLILALGANAEAGTIYKVTAKQGDKETTYEVRFGGGRLSEHMTAFDPKSKKFVYNTWPRRDTAPAPAAEIWDHRTGETIKLYKFPGVDAPLPAIPSIESMKVCPLTGDKNFKAMKHIIVD